MSKFVESVPSILNNEPKVLKFENIVRKTKKFSSGVTHLDKIITLGFVQKTLRVPIAEESRVITCTNTRVNDANINNNIYFVTSQLPKCL